ncbi:MAG: hypothetical protein IKM39_03030 [Clostridia bacterium]|nr:hypothetical protein [Clostridia bacterium]
MKQIFEQIKLTQSIYPALFAREETTPFGRFYYNPNNTLSVEANHGVLFSPGNYTEAMTATKSYYEPKNIPPRLYCYLPETERPLLEQAAGQLGGVVTASDLKLLICKNPQQKEVRSPLTFEILKEWDAGLNEHIIGENLHLEGLLRGSMKHPSYRLVVGRLFGTPVTMAGLWDNVTVMRISNVMTGEQFRGCGFALSLITHVLSLAAQPPKPVYLFANNPVAIRVYQRAGMAVVEPNFQLFTWEAE